MNSRWIALPLFSCLIAVSFNVLSSKDEQLIWQKNPNIYVKLVSQPAAQNEHPSTISSEDLQLFLSNVTYSKDNKSKSQPVFDENQISVLSKQLHKALSQASQYQDVFFAIDRIEKSFGGLSTTEYLTAGKVFLASSGINLILGDVDRKRDTAYESVYDPTRQGLVKYNLDHGSRAASSGKYTLSFSGGAGESESRSWLAVPLDTLSEAKAVASSEQPAQVMQDQADLVNREELAELMEKRAEDVKAEIARAVAEAKAPQPVQKQTAEVSPKPTAVAPEANSLAERFKVLKELRELGLITEDEYQAKRKELLSEI